MKNHDKALTYRHPRLLSALYFGLLALVGGIIADSLFHVLGVGDLLPHAEFVLLIFCSGILFGALFGRLLLHIHRPLKLKVFLLGFGLTLLMLLPFNLVLLLLMKFHYPAEFAGAFFKEMILIYIVLCLYSLILAGFWGAIVAGFASIYLRNRIVYDVMHTHYNGPEAHYHWTHALLTRHHR
jgi:hypothetical protein